jgi:predicted dehydrogenase
MSDGVLRLGIVGVGDVAQRDYLPEIGRLEPEAVVVAVAGAREERVREVARELGVEPHVGYASLVGSADVEAIVDLTPPALHEEVNAAAIEAGKPVHSEKPLALSAAAAESLAAAAAGRGVVLTAAPSILVFPQVRLVGELLTSGRIGTPVAASGAVFGGVPPWEGFISDPTPYFAEEIGPLVDLGVYPLHALTGLLGPARRVGAAGRRTRESFEVLDGPARGARIPIASDDLSLLTVELESGVLASVHSSFASAPSGGPELEVLGEGGTVSCSLLAPSAPVRLNDGNGWTDLDVPAERAEGPDHILGVQHFVRCVRGEERPILTADHAVHVLHVIEAAHRSRAEDRVVTVKEGRWSREMTASRT